MNLEADSLLGALHEIFFTREIIKLNSDSIQPCMAFPATFTRRFRQRTAVQADWLDGRTDGCMHVLLFGSLPRWFASWLAECQTNSLAGSQVDRQTVRRTAHSLLALN